MLFAEIPNPNPDRDHGAGSWMERNCEQKIVKYQSVQNTVLLRIDFKSFDSICHIWFVAYDKHVLWNGLENWNFLVNFLAFKLIANSRGTFRGKMRIAPHKTSASNCYLWPFMVPFRIKLIWILPSLILQQHHQWQLRQNGLNQQQLNQERYQQGDQQKDQQGDQQGDQHLRQPPLREVLWKAPKHV